MDRLIKGNFYRSKLTNNIIFYEGYEKEQNRDFFIYYELMADAEFKAVKNLYSIDYILIGCVDFECSPNFVEHYYLTRYRVMDDLI